MLFRMLLATGALLTLCLPARSELKAGAAAIEVTPQSYPVWVNGGMTSNSAKEATTPIHARAIVLEDERERVAIVVVDSCMMSRSFLDDVKAMASKRVPIRADRIMISATHTHTAPASMGCLGTDADEKYMPFLRIKIVEAIESALKNVEPARVGMAVRNAANYTALRQWIRRPDRLELDPFGNPTVRANMHAGRVWDDVTGESGPEDPDLSLISIQATDGRPIAVLANFSMHYFSGEKPVSADYFGRFCEGLKSKWAPKGVEGKPEFVGLMSHGCSGDIWRKDYTKKTPAEFDDITIEAYTEGLLKIAIDGLASIQYDDSASLAMEEKRIHLRYRVPDKQRLRWAQEIMEKLGDQLPKTTQDVYAREQVLLDRLQETDVVVQAIRLGKIAIATTPTETYALTGMKLKKQSPLEQTVVIELANGGDGYIPPPEQHIFGGYNTWPARSAGLEVEAEPKIVEAGLSLLERVCGSGRRSVVSSKGPAAERTLMQKPRFYWRLDEFSGPWAHDTTASKIQGQFESGVVFHLEGPNSSDFCSGGEVNRCVHTAGGRIRANVSGLGDQYAVSLWAWNGLPLEAREIAGWIFGRERDHASSPSGDAFGLAGKGEYSGKLVLQCGDRPLVYGKTPIPRWTWVHLVFVRDRNRVRLFLNDAREPEIDTEAPYDLPSDLEDVFVGGRGSRESSWEGRIDEVALFQDVSTFRHPVSGTGPRTPGDKE